VTVGPQGIQISPYGAEFGAQLEAADRLIRGYRDGFKKLAE
jgi:hypothetical protein